MSKDYRDEDGVLRCWKCGGAKQIKITTPHGKTLEANCLCKCERKELSRREHLKTTLERKLQAKRDLKNRLDFKATFENSDHKNKQAEDIAIDYIESFDDALDFGDGLLLYGRPDQGKSYLSSCIVNAILDDYNIHVVMASTPEVIAEAQTFQAGVLSPYINCDLLVLDDLDAQRTTTFATETIYRIIDGRYCKNKPMIISTNTPLEFMKSTTEIDQKRIYNRILERCNPVKVECGRSRIRG